MTVSCIRNLFSLKPLASSAVTNFHLGKATGWAGKNSILFWGIAAAFLSPFPSVAQTYFKCTTAEGKIEFSDRQCSGPSKAQQLNARSNSLDNSGFRENTLRQENQALKARLADSQAVQASSTPVEQAPVVDKSTSSECTQARRSYDVATSSINPNKTQIQAQRSQMFLMCGIAEPPQSQPTLKIARPTRPYTTRDQFGTIVRSDQCFLMKDAFGATINSPGCSR